MNEETAKRLKSSISDILGNEEIVKVIIVAQGKSDEFRYQTTYEWGD